MHRPSLLRRVQRMRPSRGGDAAWGDSSYKSRFSQPNEMDGGRDATDRPVVQLSLWSGTSYSSAVNADNEVWCWGDNH